ncbi:MAG: ABZJ_00895 family protein [Campylobacteraceae bacterium]|jgi:hypothetical protein|nr:ABZJ_00895 family protein [Campylobacteraceae bacterium]
MVKYIFIFLGFWLLFVVCAAIVFLIVGRFIAFDNLHILIAGLASISTAALFVKIEKKEPTSGEKLLFAVVIAAISFMVSTTLNFLMSDKDSLVSYIFSADFLFYNVFQTFLQFVVIYVLFHFYTKNAVKKIKPNESN